MSCTKNDKFGPGRIIRLQSICFCLLLKKKKESVKADVFYWSFKRGRNCEFLPVLIYLTFKDKC